MCNRYFRPPKERINSHYLLEPPPGYLPGDTFPRGPGAFIRPRLGSAELEVVLGLWALIPGFAESRKLAYSTNNARSERIATAASYKQAWKQGQRCVIPAEVFWEPNWESGKNVWWRFARADGAPWSLAGLYNAWTDRSSGEIVESYTLITQNADEHPLMSRMHKPDPKLPADGQDKRSVVVLEQDELEQWLLGNEADARALIKLSPVDVFDAQAEETTPSA